MEHACKLSIRISNFQEDPDKPGSRLHAVKPKPWSWNPSKITMTDPWIHKEFVGGLGE